MKKLQSAQPITWTVTDGAAGNVRQADALAAAMGLKARPIQLRLRAPWRWFAPHLTWGAWRALPGALRRQFERETPQLAIGCGRAAALVTRVLRKRGVHAVQILDPRASTSHWDTVIVPAHDGLRGDNVINTLGALHAISPARLTAAALRFAELSQLPMPRTALLVGGSNHALNVDRAYLDALLQQLARWHAHNSGTVMITTSRRTPQAQQRQLREWAHAHGARFWNGVRDGENPYLGYLAHAQRLVVTPDSVNLLSEACATGKPVYTFVLAPLRGKLAQFHDQLVSSGRVRAMPAMPSDDWTPQPLRETEAVAEQVWRRYGAANR